MEANEILNKANYIIRGSVDSTTAKEIILDILIIMLGLEKKDLMVDITIEEKQDFYMFLENRINVQKDIYYNAITSLKRQDLPLHIIMGLFRVFCEVDNDVLLECIDIVDVEINFSKRKDFAFTNIQCLNELVLSIFEYHNGNVLFNADCNSGLFITQAYKKNVAKEYIGYSYNNDMVELAKYRAELNGIDKVVIDKQPFLYPITNFVADMIYLTYPFGLKQIYQEPYIVEQLNKLFYMHGYTNRRKPSFNMLCLLNAIDNMKDNGILVTLITDGGLFNSNDQEIRKYIVEQNYLDTIIPLPVGIIPGTQIRTSLIILKKNNRSNQKIKVIDTSKTFVKQRRYSEFSKENIKQILAAYRNKEINDYVKFITIDEIRDRDYSLDFRYYGANKSVVNPTKLNNVTESIFRGYQIKASELDEIVTKNVEDTNYRIMTVADIQPEGYISDNLQAVTITDRRKFSKYCLEEGDLVITAKNTSVKMAVYNERSDIKTILSGNLICIRLDKEKCNPYYLQAFLNSDIGQETLNEIQTGTAIKVISQNKLETMIISLLDKEKQKIIAEDYQRTLIEIQKLQAECEKKKNCLKKIYRFN